MAKIKLITDSASDISPAQAAEHNIHLICFPITVGDKGYREHVDFTREEFYEILKESDEIPHTSQVLTTDYFEAYEKAYSEGYKDIICAVIASIGSNSYNNAVMAVDMFFDEKPEAKGKVNIHVIDTKGYTGVYGFPVIEAAKKIKKGADVDEVLGFLSDWFDSGVIICTAFTLKYARKSGRVGCVAAFVGEVLGLKPIIVFRDAISETVAKIRGEKAVIPKMVEYAAETMVPQTPYAILVGSNEECNKEIATAMKKKVGYGPTETLGVGATIACHLGHEVVGIIIKEPNRK